jgi:hypothetical protein
MGLTICLKGTHACRLCSEISKGTACELWKDGDQAFELCRMIPMAWRQIDHFYSWSPTKSFADIAPCVNISFAPPPR